MRGETGKADTAEDAKAFQSTPLTRGETLDRLGVPYWVQFQSTPLMRGETGSAHSRCVHYRNFNPLPSHEGRRIPVRSAGLSPSNFNPLPSCKGRLVGDVEHAHRVAISIRSPHARGDQAREAKNIWRLYFNPLPSHEGRQHKPPKIHPDLRQLTQQNHDTPLFGALQAPFCGAEPDIRGAKPTGKP